MKRQKTVMLGQAIEEWINSYSANEKLGEMSVINNWETIVGGHMAQLTKGLRIIDKVLYVKLSSGVVKQELQMIRIPLKNRINKEYGYEVLSDIQLDM
ncbi:MAG: DUF721 domain-containing protein [Salinivirgaceae bacterium]|nr:DUF721 domain-containing protein [Salinivirgaceae bacterium]MDD4746760.1 DUF721 domain-containing protein [Salinivirgaceae bacterium]